MHGRGAGLPARRADRGDAARRRVRAEPDHVARLPGDGGRRLGAAARRRAARADRGARAGLRPAVRRRRHPAGPCPRQHHRRRPLAGRLRRRDRPAARRRGLAQESMGALARWAAQRGATDAFLQVESRNTAALAVYAKLGFTRHHHYTRYQLR
ncbi:GNAT family N-acetyltransferase [Catellatospora coxensis]